MTVRILVSMSSTSSHARKRWDKRVRQKVQKAESLEESSRRDTNKVSIIF